MDGEVVSSQELPIANDTSGRSWYVQWPEAFPSAVYVILNRCKTCWRIPQAGNRLKAQGLGLTNCIEYFSS